MKKPSTLKARGPHRPLRRQGSARVIEESTAPVESAVDPGLFERPDGWYWAAPAGHQEFGPFPTCQEARADRDRFDPQRADSAPTLQEAESQIGIAEWIDTETGEPAEGPSPPHLESH